MIEREKTSRSFGDVVFLFDQRLVVTMMTIAEVGYEDHQQPLGMSSSPFTKGSPSSSSSSTTGNADGSNCNHSKSFKKSFKRFCSSAPANKCTLVFIISHSKKSQCVETNLLIQKANFMETIYCTSNILPLHQVLPKQLGLLRCLDGTLNVRVGQNTSPIFYRDPGWVKIPLLNIFNGILLLRVLVRVGPNTSMFYVHCIKVLRI